MPIWAPPTPQQRLQAKLVELIEMISIRQPDGIESVVRPLGPGQLAGRLEVRSMDLSAPDFNLLRQVLRALDRIDAGTYGTCERCQGEIPASLLSNTPWAALCSGCGQPSQAPAVGSPLLS